MQGSVYFCIVKKVQNKTNSKKNTIFAVVNKSHYNNKIKHKTMKKLILPMIAAFVLLTAIGVGMIREAKKAEELDDDLSFRTMLLLAIATSIDALAVGITFAFLSVRILPAAGLIGLTTFLLSALGVYIGHVFGLKYKAKAELAGGVILIFIGLKILLEHMGIL